MKKVLLIGDSIRMGYDAYTKDKLAGVAEVVYPSENCQFAEYVLRHLHDWAEALHVGEELDVIHWNAGLWDTLRLFEDDPLTPIDAYSYFIEKICGRIRRLFPRARIIFATSTPVAEHMWPDPKKSMRYNADIRAYNAAALKAIQPYDVQINDLFALLEKVPDSYHSDQTHFYTPEATKLIGDQVCVSILSALGETCQIDSLCGDADYTPTSISGI